MIVMTTSEVKMNRYTSCACYNAQLAFFITQNCCEYHEEYEQQHEQIDNEDTEGAHVNNKNYSENKSKINKIFYI